MTKIQHENVVKLFEVHETPQTLFLVMEILTGGELFDRIIAKGHYSEADARKLAITILTAIKHLHENGVAHRDLKPENILLGHDGDAIIKTTDFGLRRSSPMTCRCAARRPPPARPPRAPPAPAPAPPAPRAHTLTLSPRRAGEVTMKTACGTPGYVAPEVLTHENYSSQVDLWSVGVIVYILLCGFPPFYGDNDAQMFKKIKAGQYKFLAPYWDPISDDAKDVRRRRPAAAPPRPPPPPHRRASPRRGSLWRSCSW